MSILATSPTSTRHFDMNIAAALGDFNAAVIVQQLHYWMQKEGVGVTIKGVKYVYNTFVDWVNSQFKWLSVWQFRKAMSLLRSLSIVKVIRYKSKEWNQTNYYHLDCDRLGEFINSQMAESIEISEMCVSTPQDERNQTLEMRDSNISYIETKNTNQKETTKQELSYYQKTESISIAAALPKSALKEEVNQKGNNPYSAKLTATLGQKKHKSEPNKSNPSEETNVAGVDYIINTKWKALIPELDKVGIPINKTVINLLKLYPPQKVENAIALLKARKRDSHIPNLSGYFVSALKGDWGSQNLVSDEGDRHSKSEEIDQAAVFRHWYDLARELGYCSGQQIREGEQWVCLSGSWERWSDALKRGYSLEYLKKIMKRNQGQ